MGRRILIVAVLRILVPWAFGRYRLRAAIVIGAIVAIAVIVFVFDLLACAFGGHPLAF